MPFAMSWSFLDGRAFYQYCVFRSAKAVPAFVLLSIAPVCWCVFVLPIVPVHAFHPARIDECALSQLADM